MLFLNYSSKSLETFCGDYSWFAVVATQGGGAAIITSQPQDRKASIQPLLFYYTNRVSMAASATMEMVEGGKMIKPSAMKEEGSK